jgi:phosphoglycolate phosphatase-like HAD superfamily hydrolase
MRTPSIAPLAALALLLCAGLAAAQPLPSWNDTAARTAIIDFVSRVTDPASADHVPPEARIAVFDNDGTLWSEQPLYFQFYFAIDRLRELAEERPAWRTEQPYAAALAGDLEALQASGLDGLLQVIMASHAGLSEVEFALLAERWLETARHPRFDRRYADLTYLPMRELLVYLEENGFSNFIVTGGGVAFVRALAPDAYGIPTQRVIGSRLALKYVDDDGEPRLEREAEIDHINDKAGKPVGIMEGIGRRPIFAAGNSDGDLQMLEWTTAGEGPRFGMLIQHTDAKREWAYDRNSAVGHLDKALDAAPAAGWTVVDMARDWRVVYEFHE